MQNSKNISVNASSLVELKTELLKKQLEFKKAKAFSDLRGASHRPIKKQTIWDVKNKDVTTRSAKDLEAVEAEEKSISKSRCALEAKACLYEKLTKGTSNLGDEEKGLFLVNFDQKSRENVNKNEQNLKPEDSVEIEKFIDTTEEIPATSFDEEWVDYIDEFGRSRRCMRRDLPENAKLDPDSENNRKLDPMKAHLLSEDMRRQHQRQLWEQEEREAMKNPVRDIHYQDILFNEVRTHGVGYYGFSKDEEERTKQEHMLNEMRSHTIKSREAREKLLQKRKAKMAERLNKVRERKKFKIEPEEPVVEAEAEKSEVERSLEIEKKLAEIEAEHARKQHLRPWDKNKKAESFPKLSQADWVNKKRKERNWEFAPPGAICQNANKKQNLQNNNLNGNKFYSQSPSPSSSTIFYQNFSLDDIPLPETSAPLPDTESDGPVYVGEPSSDKSLPQNLEVNTQIIMQSELSQQKTFSDTQSCKTEASVDSHEPDLNQFEEILSQQLSYFKNKN